MDAQRLLVPEAGEEGPSRRGSRAAILDMLRGAARPLGIREIARRTGLHQNTARFHLEALVRLSAAEAVANLIAIMRELGFEPHAVTGTGDGQYRLELRQCPFLEVAREHRDVICTLHLGLMRGALDLMRAPVTADELAPFAEPGPCVARLTAHDSALNQAGGHDGQ
ncbi:MAG: helix-turn-helix domain-containing protein [Trebonia sp.]